MSRNLPLSFLTTVYHPGSKRHWEKINSAVFFVPRRFKNDQLQLILWARRLFWGVFRGLTIVCQNYDEKDELREQGCGCSRISTPTRHWGLHAVRFTPMT